MANFEYCVYCIICPKTKNVVYIGKSQDFKYRLKMYERQVGTRKIDKWLIQLRSDGISPIFDILENLVNIDFENKRDASKHLKAREIFWIKKYKRMGVELLNVANFTLSDYMKNKLKQNVVAEKLGITQAYLSKIESDQKEPSMGMLKDIGDYYEIPVAVSMWLSLDEFDIPMDKRAAFKQIKPLVDALVGQLI